MCKIILHFWKIMSRLQLLVYMVCTHCTKIITHKSWCYFLRMMSRMWFACLMKIFNFEYQISDSWSSISFIVPSYFLKQLFIIAYNALLERNFCSFKIPPLNKQKRCVNRVYLIIEIVKIQNITLHAGSSRILKHNTWSTIFLLTSFKQF